MGTPIIIMLKYYFKKPPDMNSASFFFFFFFLFLFMAAPPTSGRWARGWNGSSSFLEVPGLEVELEPQLWLSPQ